MGRSEELGTGLRNVYKFSKAYSGSDQIVFFEDDIFKATIPLSESYTQKAPQRSLIGSPKRSPIGSVKN